MYGLDREGQPARTLSIATDFAIITFLLTFIDEEACKLINKFLNNDRFCFCGVNIELDCKELNAFDISIGNWVELQNLLVNSDAMFETFKAHRVSGGFTLAAIGKAFGLQQEDAIDYRGKCRFKQVQDELSKRSLYPCYANYAANGEYLSHQVFRCIMKEENDNFYNIVKQQKEKVYDDGIHERERVKFETNGNFVRLHFISMPCLTFSEEKEFPDAGSEEETVETIEFEYTDNIERLVDHYSTPILCAFF